MKLFRLLRRAAREYFLHKLLTRRFWLRPVARQIQELRSSDPNYFGWLALRKLQDPLSLLLDEAELEETTPRFSILMPVYNTPPEWLRAAVRSVLAQTVPAWELIICDDASTSEPARQVLDELQNLETWQDWPAQPPDRKVLKTLSQRIRILRNAANQGIADSTNRAAAAARGEFLILLDHDDRLYPDALSSLRQAIAAQPEAGVYYSDEDRTAPEGFPYHHHFKPGFSPALLETHNYLLHLLCIRRQCFEQAGGMRKEFDGSQDFDLLLRLLDAGAGFVHVPGVLYSWGESSTSMVGNALKPEVFERGQRALQEHLARRGEAATIEHVSQDGGNYHIRFALPQRLRLRIVRYGLRAAPFDLPLPPLPARYEVTVIETDSLETAAQGRDCCDVALFLHRGLRFPAWEEFLAELCGWALRPGGGVAAAQVVTPDGRIIHAGLSLAQPETQALQFDFEGGELNPLARRVRDCLAVSGMALAVTAPRLRALAESPLNGEAWDIDLCLRARAAGMRVVYNPHARAVCAIDPARLQRHSDWATAALLTQHRIERDPYFNPYLSSPWHDFRLPRQLPLEISAAQRKAGKLPEDVPQPVQWTAPPPAYALPPPLRALSRRPFFSIILTTYNSHLDYLREMAESIHRQSYPYFEVCLSDDASSEPRLISYLRGFPLNDSRFRVYFSRQRGGIARNTNRALEMAGGDWLVLCDHDDRLESHALQCLAEYINDHPDVEIIYSDEDLMDEQGWRHNPHCRPDWNPDMFSSQMYFPHLVAIKSALADRVGWMNPELDGAQDYDFLLRLTEQGVIGHIPKVLYSWRCHPGSVAQDAAAKVYAYEAGRRALQSAMQRRGEDAVVVNAPGTALGVYRVKRRLRGDAVSHIIHANHPEALQAVRNLQREAKQPIEIIAVAPEDQPELARQLAEISEAKIISAAAGASQAACYNLGAQAAGGKILLFSPAELEVIDSDYPAAGVEHAQRDGIGAVGSRLIYPGGGYYHSGLILGVNGGVGYAHRNLWQGPGYWYYALCIRNYSAVSWDLMSVAKEKWEQAGGFDEELKMFADVDFCLKLSQRGLRHVYTPYLCGVLKRPIHRLEELQNPGAVEILRQRYGAIMDSDPCYHPLLSRQWENFSLRPEFGG